MTATDRPNFLCDEVLKQASTECEEILSRAREGAHCIVQQAKQEAARLKADQLAIAREEAERRRRLILATAPVEIERKRLAFLNAFLERIHATAGRKLLDHPSFAYAETVINSVDAAIATMAGNEFSVRLSPADRADFGELLVKRIAARRNSPEAHVKIMEDATVTEGAVVEDGGGHQIWDCRLPARLNRMWAAVREQLAQQLIGSSAQSAKGVHA